MSGRRPIRFLQPSSKVPSTINVLPLKQKACISCRTRKVKCDKASPCKNCISWSTTCLYPSPVRRCHRPRKPAVVDQENDTPSNGTGRNERHLADFESGVKTSNAAIEVQHINPNTSYDDRTPTVSREFDKTNPTGTKIAGSWVAGNELYGSIQLSVPTQRKCYNDGTTSPAIFPLDSTNCTGSVLNTTSTQLQTIWQVFRDIVDQQSKVVHLPEAHSIIRRALIDVSILRVQEHALLCAICFASTVSMMEENVLTCFNITKDTVVAAYRKATEVSLTTANFLKDPDLNTLQALVLFIAFSRFVEDCESTWPLTALARRLIPASATRIGTPFQMEMKRRMWWHLWYMDYRAKQSDNEEEEMITVLEEPELPSNVCDDDLHPAMTCAPLPYDTWTTISFSLIRLKIALASRRIENSVSCYEKKTIVNECAMEIQKCWLRHCNIAEPIHWLAKHVAHVHLIELKMTIYSETHQERLTSVEDPLGESKDKIIVDVLDILDIPARLRNEPEARPWKWMLNRFPHFKHLSFLLHIVSQQQILPPPIWTIAESAFQRAERGICKMKNLHALNFLMSKARQMRQEAFQWQQLLENGETFSDPSQTTQYNLECLGGPTSTMPLDGMHYAPSVGDMGSMDSLMDLNYIDFDLFTAAINQTRILR